MAALGVHRRDGRGVPRPVAAGRRRQRQLLQRERRGRHRPDAGPGPARPGRRGAGAAARAGLARRRHPGAARRPRRGRRGLPPGRVAVGDRATPVIGAGRCRPSICRVTVRCVRSWPDWWPQSPRARPGPHHSARCTTCRQAGWRWPWARWRSPPGAAARWSSTIPPSSSPNCRPASSSPPPHPTSCAPGPRRWASRRPSWGGPGGTGSWWGTCSTSLLEAVRQAHEGNLARLMGES